MRRGIPLGVIGVATIVASGLSYALILLVARLVDQDDYARFLTIWGVIFGLGSALSVVEQEVARQAALASLTPRRTVGREALLVTAVAGSLALVVLAILTATPLRDVLLDDGGLVLLIVITSTTGFAVQFTVRGILVGNTVVGPYGLLVVVEALIRLVATGLVALAVTDGRLIWLVAAVATGSFAWIPVIRRCRPFVDTSHDAPPLRPIVRRMLTLGAATGLTACLLTGYPAIVTAVTGTSAGLATLFAVISATRIPLVLLTPIQALTVPTVVRATERSDTGTLRRMFGRAATITVAATIGTGLIGWAVGPWVVRLLFGSGYHPPAWMTMALAASTVVLGAAQLATSALLALSRFTATAVSWASGVAVAVALLAALPGATATRAVVGLAAASVVVLLVAVLHLHRAIDAHAADTDTETRSPVPPSPIGQNAGMPVRRFVVPLLAVAAAILVGMSWTLSSPAGSSPDDNYHLPALVCPPPVADSGCDLRRDAAGRVTGAYVPATFAAASCFAFNAAQSGACRSGLTSAPVVVTNIDDGGYPGPYYRLLHRFVGHDVDTSVVTVRLINVGLAVLVLGLALGIMDPGRRRLGAVALLVSAVPLALFLIASVNPSSWAITGVSGAWLSCYTLWTTPSQRRAAAASGLLIVSAGIAALSRSDAAAYLVVAMITLAVVFGRRIRVFRRRLVAPVIVVLMAAVSFLSAGQSSALTAAAQQGADRAGKAVLFNNLMELPSMFTGWFGVGWGLGWLDTRMPGVAAYGALTAAIVIVTIGLAVHFRGKLIGLVIVAGTVVLLSLYILQREHSLVGENVQPRYFLPLLPLLVGVALMRDRLGRIVELDRLRAGIVGTLLVVAQSAALHANIRRYVTGQDVYAFNLNRDREWWWSHGPSPLMVWGIGTIAFAVLIAVALYPVLRRPTGTTAPPPREVRRPST